MHAFKCICAFFCVVVSSLQQQSVKFNIFTRAHAFHSSESLAFLAKTDSLGKEEKLHGNAPAIEPVETHEPARNSGR